MSHNWARESVCSTRTVMYNLLLVMKLKKTKIRSVWCSFIVKWPALGEACHTTGLESHFAAQEQ